MAPIHQLVSFDSEHFLHIVRHGYTHEKEHAFFPGYPVLLDLTRRLTFSAFGTDDEDMFLLMATLLQITMGALNCFLIYQLGV